MREFLSLPEGVKVQVSHIQRVSTSTTPAAGEERQPGALHLGGDGPGTVHRLQDIEPLWTLLRDRGFVAFQTDHLEHQLFNPSRLTVVHARREFGEAHFDDRSSLPILVHWQDRDRLSRDLLDRGFVGFLEEPSGFAFVNPDQVTRLTQFLVEGLEVALRTGETVGVEETWAARVQEQLAPPAGRLNLPVRGHPESRVFG